MTINERIPFELVEQVQKGNCILLLGPELSQKDTGVPNPKEIASFLAAKCNYKDGNKSLTQLAQYWEINYGRRSLIESLSDFLEADARPSPLHDLIAQGPIRIIISTAHDQQLERALHNAKRPFVNVIKDQEVSFIDETKVLLVKLYGSIEQKDSLIITQNDHLDLFEQSRVVSEVVGAYLATKTLLLVGYDLTDTNFLFLYRSIIRRVRNYARTAYALQSNPTIYDMAYWKEEHVQLIEADPTGFIDSLISQVKPLPQSIAPERIKNINHIPLKRQPYKFLDYYDIADADIFFGREEESMKLAQRILTHRFVILTGKSGVGKTSLLRAGITPTIEEHGFLAIYVRFSDDPLQSIRHALVQQAALSYEIVPSLNDLRLHSLFETVTNFVDKSMVIMVDQFEEFFIRFSKEARGDLIGQLAQCLNDPMLDIRIVLSLREDFLVELSELINYIPKAFDNIFRLYALNLEQAKDAIMFPANIMDIEVAPELIDRILCDLDSNGIEPPHLQIVCQGLYDHLQPQQSTLTLELYEELGGTKRLLASYLDSVIEYLPNEDQSSTKQVLKLLVTSRDTKVGLLSKEEIVGDASTPKGAQLARSLSHLINARLVRSTMISGEKRYELAHDFLAIRIRDWMDADELEIAHIHDLIRRELNSWQQFGSLVDPSKLELVFDWRTKLTLTSEALVMLWLSAQSTKHSTSEYWESQIQSSNAWKGFDDRKFGGAIAKLLNTDNRATRHAALRALGEIGSDRAGQVLVLTALSDKNRFVRRRAALEIGRLHDNQLLNLLSNALWDTARPIQENAAYALLVISNGDADEILEQATKQGNSFAEDAYNAAKHRRTLDEHLEELAILPKVIN